MQNTASPIIKPLTTFFGGFLDLVYPPLCLLCEARLNQSRDQICESCLATFQLINQPHTDWSVPGPLFIHQAWALFDFDPPVQTLIHQLKYGRRRKPVLHVLDHFEVQILAQLPTEGYDWVVPIPLHPRKLRERGYNQVADLAEWAAHRTGALAADSLVRRIRYTGTQTQLNAEERQTNVQGAFRVTRPESVTDRRLLLVDDVLTTGATANSLAQCLVEAGAASIDLLTISTPRLGET